MSQEKIKELFLDQLYSSRRFDLQFCVISGYEQYRRNKLTLPKKKIKIHHWLLKYCNYQ